VKTVYLGTSAFAAAVLERLADSDHRPSLVVTRPDAPAGRGRRMTAPPVAETARALGLEVLQPESVNADDARAEIAAREPEVVVVCAFGALIKEPLLTDHEMLNVHPSLLPRWRGAAPIERAIMAGDEETGVCIMRVTAGLDSGPVTRRGSEPIRDDDDFATLSARLQQLGADLLLAALDGPLEFTEQPEDGVTYAEKITAGDRTLDPAASAEEHDRVVRALRPHIGARLALADGTMLGVHRAAVAEPGAGGQPGQLQRKDGRLFYGDLELLEVQPPGKRVMTAEEALRGLLRDL
jgi:methionyl-tRNA formyltransferase